MPLAEGAAQGVEAALHGLAVAAGARWREGQHDGAVAEAERDAAQQPRHAARDGVAEAQREADRARRRERLLVEQLERRRQLEAAAAAIARMERQRDEGALLRG